MSQHSLKYLEDKKTIYAGQFDDLKIETATKRVWLSRMTTDDGMEYNNQVTVEELKNGRWEIVDKYQAK